MGSKRPSEAPKDSMQLAADFPYVIKSQWRFTVQKHSAHLNSYHLIMSADWGFIKV